MALGQARHEAGMPWFAWNDELARIANEHACKMASGESPFDHTGFHEQRLCSFPLGCRFGAENLYKDIVRCPADVGTCCVSSWRTSPAHCANVFCQGELAGVGAAKSEEGQLFISLLVAGLSPWGE
eukprot:tig00000944_g5944.t1